MLGFNDTSTLVGHFVLSPREREKRDRRDSRGEERDGQGRRRKMNESEDTEEVKTSPSTLTLYKDSRPCPTVSQYQLDAPVTQDTRHLRTTRPPLENLSPCHLSRFESLFVLRFYGTVNPMGSCRTRSVYLSTLSLGRLSPPSC